jgi:hypothetical protein
MIRPLLIAEYFLRFPDNPTLHASIHTQTLPRHMPRSLMASQKRHRLRNIFRLCDLPQRHSALSFQIQLSRIIQTVANQIGIDPARSNSINASLSIEPHDLVLHSRDEPVLQAGFARSILGMASLAEFTALAARHDDGEIFELVAESLLGGFRGEQEVLDGQESPADVYAVDILPRLQWKFPDVRMAGLVCDAGVGAEDVDGSEVVLGMFEARSDRSFV